MMSHEKFTRRLKEQIKEQMEYLVDLSTEGRESYDSTAWFFEDGFCYGINKKIHTICLYPNYGKARFEKVSPVINVDILYDIYQCKIGIERIAMNVAADILYHICGGSKEEKPWTISDDCDPGLDEVYYALVNPKTNKELLERVPHMPFLNLEVVFYFIKGDEEGPSSTVAYDQEMLERSGHSIDELMKAACENTIRDFEVYGEGDGETAMLMDSSAPLSSFLLTYNDLMDEIAGEFDDNLFIMAESCNSVLFSAEKHSDYLSLACLTRKYFSKLEKDQRLSADLYYYDRESRSLSICDFSFVEGRTDVLSKIAG